MRICISSILIACLLVATYKRFLIHKKIFRFQKFQNQNVFQTILSKFDFYTPPYKTWFSTDLASYIFGCPSPHLSSLHLTLYLHFLPDLVLCKFNLIHFWTPFITLSSLHLILQLTLHLHFLPDLLLCKFNLIHFWTPFITLSSHLILHLTLHLHFLLVLCRLDLIHFQTPSSHFSSHLTFHLHILPYIVICRFGLIHFWTPFISISLFISIFCHLVISMYLNLSLHLAT